MLKVFLVSFCFISLTAMGQTNRVLADGKLAYYGQDFYQGKITKDLIYKIISGHHLIQKDKPDQIVNGCEERPECYRHTSVGYEMARKVMFGQLFNQQDNRGQYVKDVYCGKKFYFRSVEDISHMGNEVNIEHTWPQSKFNGNFDSKMQKSDMHHLYPTDSEANNRRANHEFGDTSNNYNELNVPQCSISRMSELKGQMIFTPPVDHRGNVARSLFYFATRYKLFIGPAEEMILKIWHREDPVDQAEKDRHETIARYQKVRNPFIDFPHLVDSIADF
jgi:deoxyribonuclease-1